MPEPNAEMQRSDAGGGITKALRAIDLCIYLCPGISLPTISSAPEVVLFVLGRTRALDMSKAVPSSSIDLTTDEPVPVPSGKKRRLSNEIDIDLSEAPARGPSQRIAHNEVTKETRDLKAQLKKAEVVEASLFNKLEKMETNGKTG